MAFRRAVTLLLLLVGTGCSASRVMRLNTGDGVPIIIAPHEEEGAELEQAEVDADEFEESLVELAWDVRPAANPLRAARELFGVPARGGGYWYEGRSQKLIPLEESPHPDGPRLLESYANEALTRDYGRWCERRDQAGDCLRLLDEGPLLASDGKYTLALAIAMDSVWEETAEALKDMAEPQALLAMVTASVSMYLLLWALPSP